jgi:choice-of-anchor C domain-containing protein
MHPLRIVAAPAVALATVSGAAFAAGGNAIVNGGFEASGPIAAWRSLSAGSTAVSGWRVTSGTGALVGGFWHASSGTNSLEVGSPGAGTIAQTIATVAGRRYRLTFALAGNPDGPPRVKTLVVSAGPVTRRFAFDVAGHSRGAMGWTAESLDFTAMSSTTAIAFARLDGGASAWFGPAIDDVAVTEAGAATAVPPAAATTAPVSVATKIPATAAPDASYGGLWSAAYPGRAMRVYVERRGTSVVGNTVDGSAVIPTGSVAFTGRVDGTPVVMLAKCADADARGWHGAVIEWSGRDAFHLRIANCHAGDVLFTRWRSGQ